MPGRRSQIMSHVFRSVVVVASCVVTVAICAQPAAAAWTAPQGLPNSAGRYPLFAGYGPGGAASVGMYGPLAVFPNSPQAPVAVSTMSAGAGLAAPVGLGGGLTAPVAVSPAGTLLAVGGPRSPLDVFGAEGARSRLRIAIGALGEAPRPVAAPAIVATKTLAAVVNDKGDAAVVFSRCIDRACRERTVLATFRRRGRGFGEPLVLPAAPAIRREPSRSTRVATRSWHGSSTARMPAATTSACECATRAAR